MSLRRHDPVHLAQPVEIVLQVAQRDALGDVLGEQAGRTSLDTALPPLIDDTVAYRRVVKGQPLGLLARRQLSGDDVQ